MVHQNYHAAVLFIVPVIQPIHVGYEVRRKSDGTAVFWLVIGGAYGWKPLAFSATPRCDKLASLHRHHAEPLSMIDVP